MRMHKYTLMAVILLLGETSRFMECTKLIVKTIKHKINIRAQLVQMHFALQDTRDKFSKWLFSDHHPMLTGCGIFIVYTNTLEVSDWITANATNMTNSVKYDSYINGHTPHCISSEQGDSAIFRNPTSTR